MFFLVNSFPDDVSLICFLVLTSGLMASAISYGDGFLNRLCQEGKLKEVEDYINKLDETTLATKLGYRAGPLQYTPLHEAAANGHASVVDLLIACGADINCRSKGGQTPLYLAAKYGHPEAAQILLSYKADLSLADSFGKTAKQAAQASFKAGVALLLHSEEIVREAESGYGSFVTDERENRRGVPNKRLIQLLQDSPEDLEEVYPFLDQALVAAVLNDCHTNVGILANFCADIPKINNALHFARNLSKCKSHATLLLIKAVLLQDRCALEVLFGEHDKPDKPRANSSPSAQPAVTTPPRPHSQSESSFSTSRTSSQEWSIVPSSPIASAPSAILDMLRGEENFLTPVIGALVTKQVSAAIALPSAARNNDLSTMGELLWRVDVDPKQGVVSWHDLSLTTLSQEWLYRIRWVKTLNLAYNSLKMLHDDVHVFLEKVTQLDLQHNDLITVPPCVLTLPNLKKLDLSYNKLNSLPEVPKWSSSLLTLLLSHNALTSIAGKPTALSLSELDLSENKLLEVPQCITNMCSLKSLSLSGNPITVFPSTMARLKSLTALSLEGLRIRNIPRQALRDAQQSVRSISSRQRDSRPFPHMRVCVFGKPKRGKSSLVAHLLGRDPSPTPSASLEVHNLEIKLFGKRPIQFTMWDFNGNEALYGMHRCYLSKRTMCLVLFNLKHGTEGVEEVKYWLDSIVDRSSQVCVVVVGTHLDLVADKERSSISELLHEVGKLSTKYAGKVALKHVVTVGLKNRIENVAVVKNAMHRCAAEHQVDGRNLIGAEIPMSYHLLHRRLSRVQRGPEPKYVMTRSEFRNMLCQLKVSSSSDEGGEEELSAVLFLMDMGCLVHYDSSFYNLRDLYWVDVLWLYSTLAKVLCGPGEEVASIAEEGPMGLLEKCVVSTEFIAPLLRDVHFPQQYYNQFVALFCYLKLAFPLNSSQIFVPRLLPEVMLERRDQEYFRCIRYIAFKGREPLGFWNQLLYQIMWFIPQVCQILEKFTSRKRAGSSELVLPTLPLPELLVRPRDGPPSNDTDVQLHLWQSGVFYEDSDVTFRVQSTIQPEAYQVESLSLPKLKKEGVSIACTCNDFGKRTFMQLVGLIDDLLEQWESDNTQSVTCPECINKLPGWPFEFSMDLCLAAASSGQQSVECSHNNFSVHNVSLGNLVPELLLLHKLPSAFHSPSELTLGKLLGTGRGIQIHQGFFREKPVTITRFCEPVDIRGMKKEATLLQALAHPNIATYAGISLSMCTILTEGTPLGSLHTLLYEDKVTIPRLVVHQMAFQVSSAIQYLHARGVVLRDIKTEGVLVWSIDPSASNHCSLVNLERHTLCSNAGCSSVKSSSSVPGMSAPEAVQGSGCYASTVNDRCDGSMDIFSFAMLFYQVMSHQFPYHHVPSESVEAAVKAGERPLLCDLASMDTMFFYLSRLLQSCWHGNPQSRLSADQVVDVTVRTVVHSVMAVVPISGPQSLRCACVTPPLQPHGSRELWVCSENSMGTAVDIYSLDTMVKVCGTFLHGFQALSINAFGEHVWISPRGGNRASIFVARYRDLVVKTPFEFLFCMTSLENKVYCGTAEGECLAYSTDLGYISPISDPDVKCSLGKAVISMVICTGALWVSSEHCLYFLDLDTLAVVASTPWPEDIVLSQLTLSDDGNTVWGAQLLGAIVSAWDARTRSHMYSFNVREPMKDIAPSLPDTDMMITTVAPVLDLVWVGMATGHILQFHGRELITWFQPYNDYIRLLLRVPCVGPDRLCRAQVLSGGKLLKTPLVAGFKEYEPVDVVGNAPDSAGVLILWEAFPAEVNRRISGLEKGHVEQAKSKAISNRNNFTPLQVPEIKVTDEIKLADEPSVRLGSDTVVYENAGRSSSPGLLEETIELAIGPSSDRVLLPQSAGRVTSMAASLCESLYEYLESPFRPASDCTGNHIGYSNRSSMEETLATNSLAYGESMEAATRESRTDAIYDYPVFPSSPVSPEHLALDKHSCQTIELSESMWADDTCPLPGPDCQITGADLTNQLPDNNGTSIQQYPLDTGREYIYSNPDEN